VGALAQVIGVRFQLIHVGLPTTVLLLAY
jgi:hypothetical protein